MNFVFDFRHLLVCLVITETRCFQLIPSTVSKDSPGVPQSNFRSRIHNFPKPTIRTTSTKTALKDNEVRGGSITLLNNGNRSNRLYKDAVIVGGGLAGLSVALHLSQLDPMRQITILEKNDFLEAPAGSFAAAGMLAPNSERLPKGDYLDLCLASKRLFPDFVAQVERLAREAGEEGEPYLVQDESNLEPWNIGYVAAGGFLAPAFAGDNVATWAPPNDSQAKWLDATQVRELEPNLSSSVVGGWWFPEDASVDARRLAGSLKAACVGAGVQFLSGKNYEVSSLDLEEGNCKGLWLKTGKYIQAKSVLVANGSWMRTLLPVPVEPHKGQSLSLRMPKDQPPILRRVLFAQDSYIVPKADGRIVIGATVEAGSFDSTVTPAGIMHILNYALELVPGLANLPLEETWAGLRPTTPDKGPILGETPWKNLFLAGGYWRNGVLLAPKTGELLATLMSGRKLSDDDQRYLEAFAWDRFTSKDGGLALAANARYAAAMYPVHNRKSGVGVAASVGTELGSYSTAVSAKEERLKDRQSLWEDGDDVFEKAALMGKEDGTVFSFGESKSLADKRTKIQDNKLADGKFIEENELPHVLAISQDDLGESNGEQKTSREEFSKSSHDLDSTYKIIQEARSKKNVKLEEIVDEREDPGYRIFHVDEKTGLHREVPPFTSPGDFLASIDESNTPPDSSTESHDKAQTQPQSFKDEETYDGYQDILEAAGNDNDIAATMRKARLQNRIENEEIKHPLRIEATSEEVPSSESDLNSVYEKIKSQKTKTRVRLSDDIVDERPDPGFRIYHVDQKTGQHREVPPFTSPGEFLSSINQDAANSSQEKLLETEDDYTEKTLDGYQDIIEPSSTLNREEQFNAMREARRKNRIENE